MARVSARQVGRVPCYLEGSEAEVEEDLDVVHDWVWRNHQVHEHHVVNAEQRDQQQGGLSQTPTGRKHQNNLRNNLKITRTTSIEGLRTHPCWLRRSVHAAVGTNLYCERSFPPTSLERSFCTRMRMMLMNRMKLIWEKKHQQYDIIRLVL